MLINLTPSVQQKVLDQMTKRPKLIVLDTMNFWMDLFMEDLKRALKNIDVLTINDEEARQLSEEYSLVKAAKKILEMGPKYLIIKKGEHGALLFSKKEVFFAPALPLEEVFEVDLDMLKREISRLAEGAGLITMGKKNKMAHAFGGKPSDHPSGESFGVDTAP